MKAKQIDLRVNGHANWDDLRILLTVARHGSFLSAARELNVVTSTVSRRVAAMERKAQTALVDRRSDGVYLTQAGQSLAELAGKVELDIAAALRDVAPVTEHLQGTIRISLADGFSEAVASVIAVFAQRHPDVKIELIAEARVADLARREADLAIRTVDRQESTLIYRRVGELRYGLWAAKEYVARAGVLDKTSDFDTHQFIGCVPPFDRHIMQWLDSLGVRRWTLLCNSYSATLAAARAGVGVAALPRISAIGLVEMLPMNNPPLVNVYLVSNRTALRRPHIRAFADSLFEYLREGLAEGEKIPKHRARIEDDQIALETRC